MDKQSERGKKADPSDSEPRCLNQEAENEDG